MAQLIAHVKQNSQGSWDSPQDLTDHLTNTARLAKNFANVFQSGGRGVSQLTLNLLWFRGDL